MKLQNEVEIPQEDGSVLVVLTSAEMYREEPEETEELDFDGEGDEIDFLEEDEDEDEDEE